MILPTVSNFNILQNIIKPNDIATQKNIKPHFLPSLFIISLSVPDIPFIPFPNTHPENTVITPPPNDAIIPKNVSNLWSLSKPNNILYWIFTSFSFDNSDNDVFASSFSLVNFLDKRSEFLFDNFLEKRLLFLSLSFNWDFTKPA